MGTKKENMVRCSGYDKCGLSKICDHSTGHIYDKKCSNYCFNDNHDKCHCIKIEEMIIIESDRGQNIELEKFGHCSMMDWFNKQKENKMIVQYIKDKKGKLGCLVGLSNAHGEYSIGWSKFNRSEEIGKFDKEKAKEIAIGRALNNTDMFILHTWHGESEYMSNFPASFANDINDFMERCERYFHTDNPPSNFNWEK